MAIEQNIDLSRRLPSNLIITGNYFYKSGLSPFSIGQPKRHAFFNPWLVFIICAIFSVRSLVSLLIGKMDSEFFVMIGDFTYFLDVRYHVNFILVQFYLIVIMSQAMQFINPRTPSYMKPFQMMCGLISPQSIGITDEVEVYRMLKLTKLLFQVYRYHLFVIPVIALLLNTIPIAFHCTISEMLIYVMPWTVLYMFGANYYVNTLVVQLIYFYLICYYIKRKIQVLNNQISDKLTEKRKFSSNIVKSYLNTLNLIYVEINDYNTNYWSKFAFLLYLTHSSIISLVLYSVLFGKMRIVSRMIFAYAFILFGSILLLFLSTASQLSYEANKTYKLLAKLFMPPISRNISLVWRNKLSMCLERISKHNIGFYCWKIFILNYFRLYEIIILMGAFFLKLLELSSKQN